MKLLIESNLSINKLLFNKHFSTKKERDIKLLLHLIIFLIFILNHHYIIES